MAAKRQYFGTDGIRGAVGTPPITPDFVLKLGWAAGRVLANSNNGGGKVVIGKDTRISGYMFESVLEAGFISAGVDVMLLGPMPTPAIAYLTRTLHAQAGVVISASHNPHEDNGIKFFSADGSKLPDEVEERIERLLGGPSNVVESSQLGKAERVADAGGRYIEFCKSTVPFDVDLKGLKIAVDCANGATYHVAPLVFAEMGAEVIPVAASPNGVNINDGCGAVSPGLLREAVREHGADLGLAFDGDGDRLIMVDEEGEVLDGDELLLVISEFLASKSRLVGPVVGTVMTNLGLEEALRSRGIEMARAKVGDRYVLETMKRTGSSLGGETSGHIICLDRVTTGDGIVASLQCFAAMKHLGKSLHELKSGMTKHPQELVNVRMSKHLDVMSLSSVMNCVKEAEAELGKHGRVLLRPSGTEPLVRVMVEGTCRKQVGDLARGIADTVQHALEETAA